MESIAIIGEVIFVNKLKGYGFLKSENHPKLFFLCGDPRARGLKKVELKAFLEANPTIPRYSPSVGDQVSFKLKMSDLKPGQIEAYEVRFISNPNRERYMLNIQSETELLGELVYDNGKYFLLDKVCKVRIPLQKNVWRLLKDTDLQDYIGTLFPYVILNKSKSFWNLEAELADEFINPEFFELQQYARTGHIFEGRVLKANVSGKVYFIKLLNLKMSGVLMCDDAPGLEKGDTIMVKISNLFPSGIRLKKVESSPFLDSGTTIDSQS